MISTTDSGVGSARGRSIPVDRVVQVQAGSQKLEGALTIPPGAQGLVLFAHGSGSGRFSPRNRFVARGLQEAGLATLLIDLLEEKEARDRRKVFDIQFLSGRMASAIDWLSEEADTGRLPLGLLAASTGATAALLAAAQQPERVAALVSRGGRTDLAWDCLSRVMAPTLLIVGGKDDIVLAFNKKALTLLPCPKELAVVPGAGHLFSEPGALEEVAHLAGDWFVHYLGAHS
jgi:putative phosphoribosyl transferase